MTDYIDISVLGDKELQKMLKNLDIKLQRKYVRQSINRAMLPVKNRAKALVPVNTGKLKDSIKKRARTKRGISRAMVVTGTKQELGIPENAKGYYPAAIEYGTRHQPAQSFLRKAMTELKDDTLNSTAKYIAGYIKKIV